MALYALSADAVESYIGWNEFWRDASTIIKYGTAAGGIPGVISGSGLYSQYQNKRNRHNFKEKNSKMIVTPVKKARMNDGAPKKAATKAVAMFNKIPREPKQTASKVLTYPHANVDDIGLKRLYEKLYPQVTMITGQGGVKVNAYRDIITANKAADGIRKFGGRDQDVMQLCFLDCPEFNILANANSNTQVAQATNQDTSTNQYYNPPYDTDWRNLTIDNNELAFPFLEDQITPFKELLLEQYKINLTITNMSELDLCFEIAEVTPKQEIYDSVFFGKYSTGTVPSNSGLPELVYQNDPLNCIKRDFQQENAEADNFVGTSTDIGIGGSKYLYDQTSHSINAHGQRLYLKKHEQFNKYYAVRSKSYFKIAGGADLNYQTEIAGFMRRAEFNQLQTVFKVPDVQASLTDNTYTKSFMYGIAPTYCDFTKFIIIKAWCPNVVTSDASTSALGWAGGQYSIIMNKKVKCRGLDSVPKPIFIEALDKDGGANNLAGLDSIALANAEFVNKTNMELDTDPAGAQT